MIRVNPASFSGRFLSLDENSITHYMAKRNGNEYVDFYLCKTHLSLNKLFAIIVKKLALEDFGHDINVAITSYDEEVMDFSGQFVLSSWGKVSKYLKLLQYRSPDDIIFPFISSIYGTSCEVLSEGDEAFIISWEDCSLVILGGYYKGH